MRSKVIVYLLVATCLMIIQYELIRLGVLHGKARFQDGTMSQIGNRSKSVDISASLCSVNPMAGGPIQVNTGNMSLAALERELVGVAKGGRWRPADCLARCRLAVLVPYRDRWRELVLFLRHMHPFLQRQRLDYTIFVIEQGKNHLFNKGAVVNAGFHEVVTRGSYDCFVINDVDVLPEDDRILYECTDHPRHLAAAVSRWDYSLKYSTLFGGAIAFSRHQYQAVNGFSNAYFGWGGEDDDLSARVRHHGYKILRYPMFIAHYKTLGHKRAEEGKQRFFYYSHRKQRYRRDGLNSLKYNLVTFEEKPLFTHIVVDLDETDILQHVHSLMRAAPPS